MASKNINSKEGFTIIEVVLVLAIAGLIFLMVFIALPALQRSQRDTSRRNDMSRVDTSLVQYQTNNNTKSNNLPDAGTKAVYWKGTDTLPSGSQSCNIACQFVRDYMNSGSAENAKANEFQDPDGVPYSMVITPNWALVDTALSGSGTYSEGSSSSKLISSDSGQSYTIGGENPFSMHIVYIVPGARCNGEKVEKSQKRHFAILYRLEGAGTYCIDDQ